MDHTNPSTFFMYESYPKIHLSTIDWIIHCCFFYYTVELQNFIRNLHKTITFEIFLLLKKFFEIWNQFNIFLSFKI